MVADMYGEKLVDFLLTQFDLQELLEMNDLTDEEVLQMLIDGGKIGEPQRVLSEWEEEGPEGTNEGP
jgi:hypothetical protein